MTGKVDEAGGIAEGGGVAEGDGSGGEPSGGNEAPPALNGPESPEAPPSPPPVDRAAAFAAGAPRMSRTVVYWAVAAVLTLGLGGTLVSHLLSSSSASKKTSSGTSTLTTTTGAATTATTVPPVDHGNVPAIGARQVHSSLAAFMGLTSLEAKQAPAFSLTNGRDGATVSLSSLHGHVVVLSFFNAACNDICPVLAAELTRADADLRSTTVPVTFLTVNTDPLDVSGISTAQVYRSTSLPSLSNWQFLTGPVDQLDPVWKAYGVSITVQRSSEAVSHNDVLYFIRPDGTLAWSATPFANESTAGVFSLPASQITRFAKGIASYAGQLTRTP